MFVTQPFAQSFSEPAAFEAQHPDRDVLNGGALTPAAKAEAARKIRESSRKVFMMGWAVPALSLRIALRENLGDTGDRAINPLKRCNGGDYDETGARVVELIDAKASTFRYSTECTRNIRRGEAPERFDGASMGETAFYALCRY